MNKAWIILWSLVAITGLIGMITGALHCIIMVGIALGFVVAELYDYSIEKKQLENGKHRQAK